MYIGTVYYIEYPACMQVLCGAENGSLLMWSGGLIKFVVRQSPEVPCHRGAITVVLAEHNRRRILTAGTDGYAAQAHIGLTGTYF